MAWQRAERARVCDVVEPWAHGTRYRATRFPGFWVYNGLRLEGPAPALPAGELIAAADDWLAGLPHRHVEVEDEAAGRRLRPGFEAEGWTAERLAWLALEGPGPAGPDFEEAPMAATRELRLEWSRSAPWGGDEAALQRLADDEEAVAALRGTRALVGPGAFVLFVARPDGTAEVDQAYVTPAQRNRGLGGALVAAAVRAAGAELTFIVADDDGDSRRLYERLGFRTVWRQHAFTRRPR